MTQNEVDIIKNAVLDSTEAYVDARLDNLDFVKTQIGVVMANPIKNSAGKYVHRVRCNATRQNPDGIQYQNVLSVGNTPFPQSSVVFLIAPNAQFSNQFILGKLDDTPVNIVGGSIRLGGTSESDAPIYLTSTAMDNGSYGHIGGFYIYKNPDRLEVKGTGGGTSVIQGTAVRVSHQISSGGNSYDNSMVMDAINGRIAVCTDDTSNDLNDGIVVSNVEGWYTSGTQAGQPRNPFDGRGYIHIQPTLITSKSDLGEYSIGAPVFKFLYNSQTAGDIGNLSIIVGPDVVIFENTSTHLFGHVALT